MVEKVVGLNDSAIAGMLTAMVLVVGRPMKAGRIAVGTLQKQPVTSEVLLVGRFIPVFGAVHLVPRVHGVPAVPSLPAGRRLQDDRLHGHHVSPRQPHPQAHPFHHDILRFKLGLGEQVGRRRHTGREEFGREMAGFVAGRSGVVGEDDIRDTDVFHVVFMEFGVFLKSAVRLVAVAVFVRSSGQSVDVEDLNVAWKLADLYTEKRPNNQSNNRSINQSINQTSAQWLIN